MGKKNIGANMIRFFNSSLTELKKIDWLSIQKSVPEHLVGIILLIAFFSLFFLGVDSLIVKFIEWIFRL